MRRSRILDMFWVCLTKKFQSWPAALHKLYKLKKTVQPWQPFERNLSVRQASNYFVHFYLSAIMDGVLGEPSDARKPDFWPISELLKPLKSILPFYFTETH